MAGQASRQKRNGRPPEPSEPAVIDVGRVAGPAHIKLPITGCRTPAGTHRYHFRCEVVTSVAPDRVLGGYRFGSDRLPMRPGKLVELDSLPEPCVLLEFSNGPRGSRGSCTWILWTLDRKNVEWIGHTRPTTTLTHYVQPVAASQKDAGERLDDFLNTIEHGSASGSGTIQ